MHNNFAIDVRHKISNLMFIGLTRSGRCLEVGVELIGDDAGMFSMQWTQANIT
jgi:hypothetical protein